VRHVSAPTHAATRCRALPRAQPAVLLRSASSASQRSAQIEDELMRALERWEALEALRSKTAG